MDLHGTWADEDVAERNDRGPIACIGVDNGSPYADDKPVPETR